MVKVIILNDIATARAFENILIWIFRSKDLINETYISHEPALLPLTVQLLSQLDNPTMGCQVWLDASPFYAFPKLLPASPPRSHILDAQFSLGWDLIEKNLINVLWTWKVLGLLLTVFRSSCCSSGVILLSNVRPRVNASLLRVTVP
jgi:hypothetical protein